MLTLALVILAVPALIAGALSSLAPKLTFHDLANMSVTVSGGSPRLLSRDTLTHHGHAHPDSRCADPAA